MIIPKVESTIVYHGSSIEVKLPDIKHSRGNVDFGRGFYVTPIKAQAIKWAKRFILKSGHGVVTSYMFDNECLFHCFVKEFKSYTEEWLDYVLKCRGGNTNNDIKYDIIIGGVANDKVFNTVELYYDGLIDKGEALKRLRYEKPNVQVCIKTQEVLDKYVQYISSKIITSECKI